MMWLLQGGSRSMNVEMDKRHWWLFGHESVWWTLKTPLTWECMRGELWRLLMHESAWGTLKTPWTWECMGGGGGHWRLLCHESAWGIFKTPWLWECLSVIEDSLCMRMLEWHWRLLMHESAWGTLKTPWPWECMRQGDWQLVKSFGWSMDRSSSTNDL